MQSLFVLPVPTQNIWAGRRDGQLANYALIIEFTMFHGNVQTQNALEIKDGWNNAANN